MPVLLAVPVTESDPEAVELREPGADDDGVRVWDAVAVADADAVDDCTAEALPRADAVREPDPEGEAVGPPDADPLPDCVGETVDSPEADAPLVPEAVVDGREERVGAADEEGV